MIEGQIVWLIMELVRPNISLPVHNKSDLWGINTVSREATLSKMFLVPF